MSEHIKDVIVSIPSRRTAKLESWLLGHGFSTSHRSKSTDGAVTFYSVKDLSADGRAELKKIGAEIVSEWKPGELQDKGNAKG